MNQRDRDAMDEEMLTKLLSLADEGPRIPEDGKERTRAAARPVWIGTVRRRQRRRTLVTLAAAAAAVLALLVVGLALNRPVPHPSSTIAIVESVAGSLTVEAETGTTIRLTEGSQITEGSTLTSGNDGRAALRLANGHSLRIDRGTALTLETSGDLHLHHGGLYVDSGLTHSVGIRIVTPRGEATDIGTSFEIRYENETMQVLVRSGAVRIDLPSEKIRVDSGRGVVIPKSGSRTWLDVTPHGTEWDWTQAITPPFEVEGRTVEAFLRWYERETGRKVRFADTRTEEIARETTLHGTTIETAPEGAAEGVLMSAGLEATKNDGEITIRSIDPGAGLAGDD